MRPSLRVLGPRGLSPLLALLAFASPAVRAAEAHPAAPPEAHAKTPPRPGLASSASKKGAPLKIVRVKNAAELEKMQAYLKAYEPAAQHVKHTFVADAGHTIQCVDRNQQPAMHRPELRGHEILSPPPASAVAALHLQPGKVAARAPKGFRSPGKPAKRAAGPFLTGGRDSSGRAKSCPEGTIPYAKKNLEHLKSFATLNDFHMKLPRHLVASRFTPPHGGRPAAPPQAAGGAPNIPHDHAHVANWNVANYGASTTINVISPYVLPNYNEFSLSQLWITATDPTLGVQTLETGIISDPDHHGGDSRPRVFAYSTTDGYQNHEDKNWWQTHTGTSCYAPDCGQFVQVNHNFDWNLPLGPGEVEVMFVKYGAAWWLRVQSQWVGYYPTSLYTAAGLRDNGKTIDFGGEIVDNLDARYGGHPLWHTTTAMGTGAWPEAGWGHASYQRNMSYFASPSGQAHYPATALTAGAERPGCYRSGNAIEAFSWDKVWGTYFFYGGPGYSWTSNACKL